MTQNIHGPETDPDVLETAEITAKVGLWHLARLARRGTSVGFHSVNDPKVEGTPAELIHASETTLRFRITVDHDGGMPKLFDETTLLVVITAPDQPKIQFICARFKLYKPSSEEIFAESKPSVYLQCPFPDKLWWIQRRDVYRVKSPTGLPIFIGIRNGNPKEVLCPAVDFGLNGVAMDVNPNEVPVEVGSKIYACRVLVGSRWSRTFDLIVRNASNSIQRDGMVRLGCAILRPSVAVTQNLINIREGLMELIIKEMNAEAEAEAEAEASRSQAAAESAAEQPPAEPPLE
ncbi:MAG: hypothetical protein MO847_08940 [Candidatus Protistobacter heckmanni]|nr:hypothetical protein [Candidatus Protistobacter heckmanni]